MDEMGNGLQFVCARLVQSFHISTWARMSETRERQLASTGWLVTRLTALDNM
jgi:hypothetical protein